MRLVVCGGRDYYNQNRIYDTLTKAHSLIPITLLAHGAARGADTIAGDWAKAHDVPVAEFPADWNAEPRRAGMIRNSKMLAEVRPHLVLAFPGGRGTADCVAKARKAGYHVLELKDK
jgi:hypothetical protein